MVTIGQRLRWARDQAELSARELDRLAGKTPGHAGLIEARGTDAWASTLAAYARVLGLSLDWLIAGEKRRAPKPARILVAVKRARKAVQAPEAA